MKIALLTYLATFVGVISISLLAGLLHKLFSHVSLAKITKLVSGLTTQPA